MNAPPSPHASLAGKVALVTGGARRVGASIVRTLHGAGAQVMIHCHQSIADAALLAEDLDRDRPGSAGVVSADLLDLPSLPRLVDAAISQFGRLDLLVNNASTFYPTPFGSIDVEQWDDLFGTNLRAPLFLSQAAATALRRSRGSIINLIDIHATRPLRDHMVYCTAKAALVMLTRSLARELAPDVRVNGIAPGAVMWPEHGMDEERQTRIIEQTPLHRPGSAEDIARTVLFLSGDAPFITGQIIAVDGGRSLAW